jgi:lipid II:glycine glycyltransferase (peptidoglycan interpeptide bridge formation enzyme)
MEIHKGLEPQVSERELIEILKLVDSSVILYKCENIQGELIAIRACAVWRDQSFDLLAAASLPARKVYASHGLLWALFNQCAVIGVSRYDLGGVDPIKNKGVFDFKKGTGAQLIKYLGEWEYGSFPFLKKLVSCLMYIKNHL